MPNTEVGGKANRLLSTQSKNEELHQTVRKAGPFEKKFPIRVWTPLSGSLPDNPAHNRKWTGIDKSRSLFLSWVTGTLIGKGFSSTSPAYGGLIGRWSPLGFESRS